MYRITITCITYCHLFLFGSKAIDPYCEWSGNENRNNGNSKVSVFRLCEIQWLGEQIFSRNFRLLSEAIDPYCEWGENGNRKTETVKFPFFRLCEIQCLGEQIFSRNFRLRSEAINVYCEWGGNGNRKNGNRQVSVFSFMRKYVSEIICK